MLVARTTFIDLNNNQSDKKEGEAKIYGYEVDQCALTFLGCGVCGLEDEDGFGDG